MAWMAYESRNGLIQVPEGWKMFENLGPAPTPEN